jgi:DNA-binding CsgD family transcriptional regulator
MAVRWTEEQKEMLGKAICELMCDGKSTRQASEQMGVSICTFMNWVDANPALSIQYAHARARLIDAKVESMEEIADEAMKSENAARIAGARLLIDTIKWTSSKLASKKYGDRLEIDQKTTLTDLTEAQIDARLAQLSKPSE